MKPYTGKHIWLIGASSGIGYALALELARQGATLALSARRQAELEALETQLEGGGHIVLPLDVRDEKALAAALKDIGEKFTTLDSTVFLAAAYQPHDGKKKPLPVIRTMMDVNLGGVFNLLDCLLPYYEEQKHGQLAVTASVAGYRGLPTGQPYCAAKAALISLCESLRIEYAGTGIDIKIINPGFVKTPLTDKNGFRMPMMIEAPAAATAIARGLQSRAFEIHFPKKFTLIMKVVRLLPSGVYIWLARKTAAAL